MTHQSDEKAITHFVGDDCPGGHLDDMQPNEFREPVEPRKCVRHRWTTGQHILEVAPDDPDAVAIIVGKGTATESTLYRTVRQETWCRDCGKLKDEALSRRANNNRKRGNRIQRERIVALGGRNLAGNNPNLDGLGRMFAYESKSGGSFSDRYWRWLTGIPKRGNETGVLIVTEAPGPGRKARSYVVVEYDEWLALHGELEAQQEVK